MLAAAEHEVAKKAKTSNHYSLYLLGHVPFILIKHELLESDLNGVASRCWYTHSFREVHLKFARLSERALNCTQISIVSSDLNQTILFYSSSR